MKLNNKLTTDINILRRNFLEMVTSDLFEEYAKMYLIVKSKKVSTPEELIDLILDSSFTMEDMFDERFNHIDLSEDEEDFWLDNLDRFEFKNYFPHGTHDVGQGSWIKVRTENGFAIRFAKKSTRKLRFEELYISEMNKAMKRMKTMEFDPDREDEASDTIKEYAIRMKIGMRPYEVWYWRTKTRKTYLMPYEYELVSDIDEYIQYVSQNVPHLKVHPIYDGNNSDKIHYIMSRGIPRKVATIMAGIGECYFTFNMEKGMEQFNKEWSEGLKQLQL